MINPIFLLTWFMKAVDKSWFVLRKTLVYSKQNVLQSVGGIVLYVKPLQHET